MSYDIERGQQRGYQGNSGVAGGAQREDPLVTSLKDNIKQISNNVASITKYANVLGTARDTAENRAKLNSTIETTKLVARTATQQMKDLGTNTRGSVEERNQQKIIQQKLAKDLGTYVQKFQEVSKIAAQKERSTALPPPPTAKANQGAIGRPSQDQFHQYEDAEDEKSGLLESSRRENFMQIENEREFTDAMIQDREEGIKQIESTIREVNGIFTDLAQIVHEQGYMIDNIESNVESASHNTAEAVVELRNASKYQRRSRTKMCILLLIVSVVLGAIVLILFLKLR